MVPVWAAKLGSFLNSTVGSSAGQMLGSIGGSIWTSGQQKHEAEKQRDWLYYMSKTAHQREVKDLRKAGLNPILSAGGSGASVGAAAQAQIPNLGEAVTRGLSSATAYKAAAAQVRQLEAQARTAGVDAELAEKMLARIEGNPAMEGLVLNGMMAARAGVSANARNFLAALGVLSPRGSSSAQSTKDLLTPEQRTQANKRQQYIDETVKKAIKRMELQDRYDSVQKRR